MQDWEVSRESIANQDPLLACLMFLSSHYDNPTSATSLTERLPLVDNKLTPDLFVRAAKRAQLVAEINPIALANIEAVVLPAVLLLKNEEACVLLKKGPEESTVLMSQTGLGEVKISNKALEEKYTGYAIYVKPVFQFTKTEEDIKEDMATKDWFWSVIKQSWPIYSEVLAASVLVNLFALAMPLFIMNVYDRVVPNHAMETMWVLASGIGLVFIFDLLLKTLRGYFIDVASKKTDVKLSSRIFEQILGIQMAARP